MYRKYRAGDLPDIQINYSYIIAPLQALAQRDQTVARLLFSSLVKSIIARVETDKSDEEKMEVLNRMNDALGTMLTTSVQYCPPFIAALLVSMAIDLSQGSSLLKEAILMETVFSILRITVYQYAKLR